MQLFTRHVPCVRTHLASMWHGHAHGHAARSRRYNVMYNFDQCTVRGTVLCPLSMPLSVSDDQTRELGSPVLDVYRNRYMFSIQSFYSHDTRTARRSAGSGDRSPRDTMPSPSKLKPHGRSKVHTLQPTPAAAPSTRGRAMVSRASRRRRAWPAGGARARSECASRAWRTMTTSRARVRRLPRRASRVRASEKRAESVAMPPAAREVQKLAAKHTQRYNVGPGLDGPAAQ